MRRAGQSTPWMSPAFLGLSVLMAAACSSGSESPNEGSGGTASSPPASGGSTASAAGATTGAGTTAVGSSGAAGQPATVGGAAGQGMGGGQSGGPASSAGTAGAVATSGGSGGASASGGAGASGGGGRGGASGAGGGSGAGGAAGTAGTAGAGGGAPGSCTKGTKGAEVAVIGESFIALSHGITQEIEKRAKAAGSLGKDEHYVDNSVSGTTLANNQIPSQYAKAAMSGKIKYVLMDGGGNDCLINNDGAAALTAAEALFKTMAEKGTEKVVYFFYPDPLGTNYVSLKSCLDAMRPKMKALCDGLTAPKCYWLDQRPIWDGHADYTSDGIHPTAAGSAASGAAIWETMVTSCVAQ